MAHIDIEQEYTSKVNICTVKDPQTSNMQGKRSHRLWPHLGRRTGKKAERLRWQLLSGLLPVMLGAEKASLAVAAGRSSLCVRLRGSGQRA